MNINSKEALFYLYSIFRKKSSGSFNDINNPGDVLCVPFVFKNINIKVFHLMSRTNEIRNMEWHKTYPCKCRLDPTVCNHNERWNNDKCRFERKELIDKGKCEDGFICNPSTCECDKSCDVAEYLDCVNCICRKCLIDKLALECENAILNTTDTVRIADNN